MPRREVNPEADKRHRQSIQTSKLVNRLGRFALSHKSDPDHDDVHMTRDQIQAAKVLLAKTLPDLSAVEQSGDVIHRIVSEEPMSPEEWTAQHADEG